MDGFNVTYTFDTRVLDKLIVNMPENADQIVRKTAFRVEGYAKMLAIWETTAMKNSIYVVTSRTSEFMQAAAMALALRPDANIVELPTPNRTGVAYVGPCVDYGVYVELGHHTSTGRMITGRPFMAPALTMTELDYTDMEELLK